MKRGWLWVALVLSLGVNIGVLATVGLSRIRAVDRAPDRAARDQRPPPFERLADHLRLEGPPRQRFIEIQRDLFETTRRHRQRLEEIRTELRHELMAERPDRARVEELQGESARVNAALERAMIESVLASREVLDAEQQQRYFRVMERLRRAASPAHPPQPRGRRPPPGP